MKFLILTLLLLTTFACTKSTDDSIAPPSEGEIKGIRGAEVGRIYPHSARFLMIDHGKLFYKAEKQCQVCHGTDLKGGNSGSSCQGCHQSFPHDSTISDFSVHGPLYKKDPANCMNCHGEDKSAKTKCLDCHQFPHNDLFKLSKNHGLEYRKDKESCKKCHGNDLLGGISEKSCSTCHDNFPHQPGFLYGGAVHGAAWLATPAKCTTCHKLDTKMLEEKKSCFMCHHYPHNIAGMEKWSKGLGHGQAMLKNNDYGVKCENCHSDKHVFSTRHPEKLVRCDTCHVMMPHKRRYRGRHKGDFGDKNPVNCQMCHIDLQTRLNPRDKDINCMTCHSEEKLRMVWQDCEEDEDCE